MHKVIFLILLTISLLTNSLLIHAEGEEFSCGFTYFGSHEVDASQNEAYVFQDKDTFYLLQCALVLLPFLLVLLVLCQYRYENTPVSSLEYSSFLIERLFHYKIPPKAIRLPGGVVMSGV